MQKKIIALAIAGLMSGAAFAQSNVTVYGRAHMSVDFSNNNTAGSDRSTTVATNSSRLGFKGTEDLGNGLKAIWQYEVGVDAGSDSANTALFGAARDTFLGLQGSWGTFTAGRQSWNNTFAHDTNVFTDQVGDATNYLGGTKAGGRKNNLLRYTSPSFSGFTAMVQFAPRDDMTTNADSSYQGKLSYANGPIAAALTHTREGNRTDHTTTLTEHVKVTSLSGSYDFGMIKLGAQWVGVRDIAGRDNDDRNDYNLSAAWKVTGTGTVKAQYTRLGESDSAGGQDDGARMWAIGYDHALSKRTTAYVAYSRANNDRLATTVPYGSGHDAAGGNNIAPGAGKNPSSFSVGLAHNF